MSYLDKSLRESLGRYEVPYAPAEWSAMEDALDTSRRRAAQMPWRIGAAAMFAGLCAFGAWMAFDSRPDSSSSVVKSALTAPGAEDLPSMTQAIHTQPVFFPEQGAERHQPAARPLTALPAPGTLSANVSTGVASLDVRYLESLGAYPLDIAKGRVPGVKTCEPGSSALRPRWRLHLESGPGLAAANPWQRTHGSGIAASVDFGKWRAVLGMALLKFALPGTAEPSMAFAPPSSVSLIESRFALAEFTLNVEHDLVKTGRLKPFVYAGTAVMAPLKETYTYQYQNTYPATDPVTVAGFEYDGLDARVGPVQQVNITSEAPPSYKLEPYMAVQAGAGVNYHLSESTAVTARAQFQKALGKIGLEEQNYMALNTQVGLRFGL